MQITPVASPLSTSTAEAAPSQAAQDAKSRAIAMLTGNTANAQTTPVPDPSKVSAEDVHKTSESEGQARTDEGSQEPPKAATAPKEEPLSGQYAQLARKEKALRSQAQELKATEARIKAREDAVKAKESPAPETAEAYKARIRAQIEKDPVSAAKELGLSYEQLTNAMLNQPTAEDQHIQELRAQIQELKQGQDQVKQSYQEQVQNQYNQAVNEIRKEVKKLVFTDENFETIKGTNSVEDVVELIKQTYDKDGTLLSVEEAAQEIEDYLLEEAVKLASIKKVQKRINAPQASQAGSNAPVKASASEAPKQVTMKTLTNAVGSSKPLTSRDRAILAFKGELKK